MPMRQWTTELAQNIRALPQPYVLSSSDGETSATLTALAAKARALMTQNDPDAIRAGLRQIVEALDELGGRDAPPILDEAAD